MNMKIQSIYHLMQAALFLLLASCTQEEFPAVQDKAQQLTISVIDGGYTSAVDNKGTRAVENGYTTEFTEGDTCGLFMIRDKKMVYANVKLIARRDAATGSLDWKPEAGTTLVGRLSGEKYYLYYPYKPDLDNENIIKQVLDIAINLPHQHPLRPISRYCREKHDQSSYADYTASDLMTGSCTPTLDNGMLRLNFVMTHERALIIIELPKTIYKFGISNKIVRPEATFTGVAKPLRMADGTYRYLISTFIYPYPIEGFYDEWREFTITPDNFGGGEYKRYVVDGG